MNKQIEALKLALEALDQVAGAMPFPVALQVRAAIREALMSVPDGAEQPAQQWCMRCNTPKKCELYGCSPLTWPAEQPAQQWNPNDHYKDGWRDGMLAAQQHDRVRELECVIADLKAECRELIAQQEQEPVAWMYPDDYERMTTSETFCTVYSVEVGSATRGETTVALYTSPPASKPWVGLTDEEIDTWNIVGHESLREFVRAIEAKLREKNA